MGLKQLPHKRHTLSAHSLIYFKGVYFKSLTFHCFKRHFLDTQKTSAVTSEITTIEACSWK